MKKYLFIVVAGLLTFGAASCNGSLFISEYVEGSSNNKALEIFNSGHDEITLSDNAQLQIYFNGSEWVGRTIELDGSLSPGDVFVLGHGGADAAIRGKAHQTSSGSWFNGDDAIELLMGGNVVDSIGQVGVDPGSQWGSALTSTKDNTLRRKPHVLIGDADSSDPFDPSNEWDGLSTDTFGGLGSHNVLKESPAVPEPRTIVVWGLLCAASSTLALCRRANRAMYQSNSSSI